MRERTKIIQEGLLNPSGDILEAMTETEAMHTGKTLIHFQISTLSLHNQNHPSSAHSYSNVTTIFISLFFLLDFASKPIESLEQIAAFDVEKLLSKSAILSENLLLQFTAVFNQGMGSRIH